MDLKGWSIKIAGILNKVVARGDTLQALEEKYKQLLIDEEYIELGFTIFRDVVMFTNKRLILIDVQGLMGNKIEYKSIPYKSISRFSLETTGNFDLDTKLRIWAINENTPGISKRMPRKTDAYEVQRYLAQKVL